MGSPEEPSINDIDASVGGLVWVRRRNGSWWPGRILGPDELPESCLVSPRLGTPVKLLGRDDASVDWYNLEKSKRVKPFRCGEYDECIEKAKASAANSSKKAVKYARREDAILHALELESARQSKDDPEFFLSVDRPAADQFDVEELPSRLKPHKESEPLPDEQQSFDDYSNSAHDLSQSGVSFEEPNHITAPKDQSVQGRRRRTPNDSEDDGTEGIKRMRGLEDLGMGVVSSLKRKRSQVANVHELQKRKNRRRQLTKVLESTAMVSVPVTCEQLASPVGSPHGGMSECKVAGLESNESKRDLLMVVNSNSDSTGVSCENDISMNASEHACDTSHVNHKQNENESSSMFGTPDNYFSERLFDVPFVGDEEHSAGVLDHTCFSPIIVSCAPQEPQVAAGVQSSLDIQIGTMSLGNIELNEAGSTSSGAADMINICRRIQRGTSKWQLKGKRNLRYTSKSKKYDLKKLVDMDDESNEHLAEAKDLFSLGFGQKVGGNAVGGSLNSDSCSFHDRSRPVTESQDNEFQGCTMQKEPHNRGPTFELLTPQRSLLYRQSRFTMTPQYPLSELSLRNYDADSVLYDVNLEVKASYRPQHVPYISLMSKLTGQPIIGHPLTVEVLEDGVCDVIISTSECYSSNSALDDDLGENANTLEEVYDLKSVSAGGRTRAKHLRLRSRASPAKPPKSKKNGSLSKKIRKLSSLTGTRRQSEKETKPVVEKMKGPAIACVPLKVVFSRINAALGGSMRPIHRVIASSNL